MASSDTWNAFHMFKNGLSSSMSFLIGKPPVKVDDVDAIQNLILEHSQLDAYFLMELLVKQGWVACPKQGFHSLSCISPLGDYVLRIGKRGGNEAYAYHATLAIQQEDNPYFQKIYWHAVSLKMNCTYTLMERLYDVNGIGESLQSEEIENCLPFGSNKVNYRHIGSADNSFLRDALSHIERVIQEFGYASDIKNDNIMQRRDGQLVIIDSIF